MYLQNNVFTHAVSTYVRKSCVMEYCHISQTVAAVFFTAGLHVSDQLVQEATGMGTPPLFAHFHPAAVYDHRPGVPTERRQSPEGGL